jgi:SAM-dependent methyltransferase
MNPTRPEPPADGANAHAAQALGAELAAWFDTPPGRYLLQWEQARFDEAVADVFGYNALQLGLSELDALAANRMPHRWLALPEAEVPGHTPASASRGRVALVTHAAALPFPESSIDLVLLPHTLELSADPHAVLREVERVLVPQGKAVISGLNPASLWGLRQYRAHFFGRVGLGDTAMGRLFLPEAGAFIGHWRLHDWLKLLSFEVESCRHGCYRPAVSTDKWLARTQWMDRWGERWWPVLGSVYFTVAVKRVRGMHLLGPAWKPHQAQAVPVAVARRTAWPKRVASPSVAHESNEHKA